MLKPLSFSSCGLHLLRFVFSGFSQLVTGTDKEYMKNDEYMKAICHCMLADTWEGQHGVVA